MKPHKTLRRVCQLLRLQDIPTFKLHLVQDLADEAGVWADVSKGKKLFTVRLDKQLAADYPQVGALLVIHEAAHIVTWDTLETDHGPTFGLAYSMLYRLWMAELG